MNGGLATIVDVARHLRAALASEQTEQNLEIRPRKPTAFFSDGALMTVARRGDVIRITASTEAGAIIVADIDYHIAATFGLSLLGDNGVSTR